MRISVILCTWNRAALLDRALDSMRALRVPSELAWELLVVDNNSTDTTSAVLEKYETLLPLRRLFEATPGKSHALNRALAEARGRWLVFTDDDVAVAPEWLAAYDEAFGHWAEAAYFGGRIEPWYETAPPAWITANLDLLEGMLVIRDFGPTTRSYGPGEAPFGANMALRKDVFDRHAFDTRLGPNEQTQVRGEETELIARLADAGHTGVWVPEAVIRHFTPRARLSRRYVWDYGYGNGRALARARPWPPCRKWRGAPLGLYREYMRLRVQAAVRRALGTTAWVEPYMAAARCRGKIDESRSLRPPSGRGAGGEGKFTKQLNNRDDSKDNLQ